MSQLLRHRNGRRDLLSQIHNDFDRLLTSSPFDTRTEAEWPEVTMGEWMPSIDLKEEKKRYILSVDVPGVKAENIDINMENGLLTIKGTRECEKMDEKENYLCLERSSGAFLRQLSLPEAIDPKHIDADYHNGVLTITLPKATQHVGQKIKVNEH